MLGTKLKEWPAYIYKYCNFGNAKTSGRDLGRFGKNGERRMFEKGWFRRAVFFLSRVDHPVHPDQQQQQLATDPCAFPV